MMSPQVDIVIVVGSPTSSNSNRLREVAQKLGTVCYMVDHANELDPAWFVGRQRIGLTAGASAPELLVQAVISRLRSLGAVSVRRMDGLLETVKFPLPKGLKMDTPCLISTFFAKTCPRFWPAWKPAKARRHFCR